MRLYICIWETGGLIAVCKIKTIKASQETARFYGFNLVCASVLLYFNNFQ